MQSDELIYKYMNNGTAYFDFYGEHVYVDEESKV
jgi:hypothetical protein